VGQGIASFLVDAQPETTTPTREKHSAFLPRFIAWPFVILFLYVFSFGPMQMILDANRLNPSVEDALKAVYHPMWPAYVKTPLHKPLGIYLHLWLPDQIDKNGDALPNS
jgi:hypothetical protein